MRWTWKSSILPFIDQGNLKGIYNDSLPWLQQDATLNPTVASIELPAYQCPSATGAAVETFAFLTSYPIGMGIEGGIASTNQYLLSKGATDGWCLTPRRDPNIGMFAINLTTKMRDLTDGSSNTLCVGEGATGSPYLTVSEKANPLVAVTGTSQVAQSWIIPQPFPPSGRGSVYGTAGGFGTTVCRMNLNPVVETVYDDANLSNCNAALDSTSNFRSTHTGGSQFLLGDGSGRFISENIDQGIFNALGTRGAGETIGEF